MKRIVLCILLVIFTSGCIKVEGSLTEITQNKIEAVLQQDVSYANYNKTLYSYYIEPSVGRLEGNETGNIFTYQGNQFLMNLNISSIVNESEYPTSTTKGMETIGSTDCYLTGTYTDIENKQRNYELQMKQVGNSYLTLLNTDIVNFYAISDQVMATDLAAMMIKIARTVTVNSDEVIAIYSNNEVLNYETKKVQLFNPITPENGSVNDLINDNQSLGNQGESDDNGKTQIISDDE